MSLKTRGSGNQRVDMAVSPHDGPWAKVNTVAVINPVHLMNVSAITAAINMLIHDTDCITY